MTIFQHSIQMFLAIYLFLYFWSVFGYGLKLTLSFRTLAILAGLLLQLGEYFFVFARLLTLLRSNEQKQIDTSTVKAFEILNNQQETLISEDINLFISNKFFMYLLIESIRNSGIFGLPFPGWKKSEIEKQKYFEQLKDFFNKVIILGPGEEWTSTHLIVAEPSEKILDFVIDLS
jgi:hypothetical protein